MAGAGFKVLGRDVQLSSLTLLGGLRWVIKAQLHSRNMFPDRSGTEIHFLLGNAWGVPLGPLSVPSNVEILMTSCSGGVQNFCAGFCQEHRSGHRFLQARLAAD